MKYTYRFHFADYAIGENEQFYENMAQKGWMLVKRGVHLSKFERCEPQELRYRIELSTPGFLEDAELPEEQIALYEDCGWEFVTSKGLVHVFSAPSGSDAQEFYTEPSQQAATLKALRRSYRNGWISIVVILSVHLLIAYGLASDPEAFFPNAWATLVETWFRSTELVLVYAVGLTSSLYDLIYGAIRTVMLYRHLKAGKPLEHAPRKRTVHYSVKGIFWTLQIIALLLLGIQLFSIEQYDMPLMTNEPYLTLTHNLQAEGERDEMAWQSDGSTVERGHSLAAKTIWYTHEHVGDEWLYQHIYHLRDQEQVKACVEMLMYTSTFAQNPRNYVQIPVAGLDEAYRSGLDGIAVKGNLVYYITYSEGDWETLFAELAQKLSASITIYGFGAKW